jgi:hypothetical protein
MGAECIRGAGAELNVTAAKRSERSMGCGVTPYGRFEMYRGRINRESVAAGKQAEGSARFLIPTRTKNAPPRLARLGYYFLVTTEESTAK